MNSGLMVYCLSFILICQVFAPPVLGDDIALAAASYDYKTWDCRIEDNKFVLTVKHRLTINNRRGDGYRTLRIRENEYTRLERVDARVLDAWGSVIYTRDKDDMTKACGFGSVSLYSDACLYYTLLESSQYPYVIEYEYQLTSKSLFFWRGAQFQHYIPVRSASYQLSVPRGFEFNSKLYGMDLEPRVTESEDRVVYLWSASDLPAIEEIDHLPPGYNEGACMDFAAERFELEDYELTRCNWTSIGLWYRDLAHDRYLSGGGKISAGDPIATARALFDETRRQIRYVAVNVGLGGWRPHRASQVDERGYGDCKDMSTLLISRLRGEGIEAYPCLVLTRSNGRTDVDFPNFNFNHVITMAVIGIDTLWLDCTSDNCTFRDIPWTVEDVDGLVVTPQGGQIRRIAASTARDNQRRHQINIHVNEDRRITLDAELEATGNYAKYLRDRLESCHRDETRRFINGLFDGAEKKYRIDSFEVRNAGSLDEPVTIGMSGLGIKPEREIGNTLYLNPFLLDELDGYEETDLQDRSFPLYLYYPETMRSDIIVTWDSSLTVDSVAVPEGDSLSYPFGDLQMEAHRAGDTVYVRFVKAYHTYQLESAQFSDFEDFRGRNKDIIRSYIKLIDVSGE